MITITKPSMDERVISGSRAGLVEHLDACPRGTTAALPDGSLWQAVVPAGGEPLWQMYAGPGCFRTVTGSALASRAVNLSRRAA